jgi:hypothetical protein
MFQPACFFNRQYIDRDFFVDTKYHFAFDFDLILSLSSKQTTMFLNRDVASYRVHDSSKSHLHKIEAYKEKLSLQEKYSRKDFLLIKWKRLKLAVAQKTGQIANGKAAL